MVEFNSDLWKTLTKYVGYIDHYASTLPQLNGLVNLFNNTISQTNSNLTQKIQPQLDQIKQKAEAIKSTSVLFKDANELSKTTNPVQTMQEVNNSITHINNMISYIQSILDNFQEVAGTVNHMIHTHSNPTWGWSATVSYAGEFMKKIDRPSEIASISSIGNTVSSVGQQLSTQSGNYYNLVANMIPQTKNALESVKKQLSALTNKMQGPLQQLHSLAGGQ